MFKKRKSKAYFEFLRSALTHLSILKLRIFCFFVLTLRLIVVLTRLAVSCGFERQISVQFQKSINQTSRHPIWISLRIGASPTRFFATDI
jgi:hypothetical protein